MKGAYRMERITSEDIKALREYLDKLEAWNREDPPEQLTPEEWDEALKEIEKTGKIPAKYAGRIGKSRVTVQSEIVDGKHVYRPEGVEKTGYYDIAENERYKRLSELHKEYQKAFEKAIMFSLMNRKDGEESPQQESGTDFIRRILENPVIMRELEKEARRMEKRELPALGALPNSEPLNLLYHIMIGSKGGRIIKGSNTNRHEGLTLTRKPDGSITYTRNNKGNVTIIDIKSANLLFENYHKGFTKILTFVLQEMAAQNFPHLLGFPLKELVDLGMYTTTSNAGRALNDFFLKQDNILIGGQAKKGNRAISQTKSKLFYNLDISKNGFVTLSVNEQLNWEYLASYFTVFPRFAYKLKTNAFALVRYIFFVARQNGKKIKDSGKFTISLDTVREQMGLPSVEQAGKNPGKLIIKPIEDAITEIEDALQSVEEAKEYGFTITPVKTGTNKVNEWLQGYLEIGLSGKFAETFIQIATKAEREQEQWEKAKREQLARIAAREEAAKKE